MATNSGQTVAGVAIATLSFITLLLTIPPMTLHFRNRNTAAALLIAWLSVLLLFNFVNALLWPANNWDNWYNGVGLCDVEVKVYIGAQVALPSSLACILRRLAKVLDVERQGMGLTKAQKRKDLIMDLLWCIGFPMLQMIFHLIVQSYRYYIFGTYGCYPYVGGSWVAFVLLIIPPAVWVGVDVYFAVLILIRLYRYRVSFGSILESNNTTRSRFLRLYLLCLIFIVVSLPVEIYVLYENASQGWHAFDWSHIHSSQSWHTIIEVYNRGRVLCDRWIILAFGILVFAFFGLGKEAIAMYRSALLALRVDKVFPRLKSNNRILETSPRKSLGIKAKALFKHTSASSTSTTHTSEPLETQTSSSQTDSPPPPPPTTYLETISERMNELDTVAHDLSKAASNDIEALAEITYQHSLSRISSLTDTTQWIDAFNAAELSGDGKVVHPGTRKD